MSIAPKPTRRRRTHVQADLRQRIEPFDVSFAATVAAWVRSEEELRVLAPATSAPLTAQKVAAWQRPNTRSFLMFLQRDPAPTGYAELNRMRKDPYHWWLGHVVISPDIRGRGVGEQFVRDLLSLARNDCGARRLSLIVCPDNRRAVRCYERVGFDLAGEEVHRFGTPPRRTRMLRYELGV